jgi:decaprenylphospho-beta-D-erythro-pentofuranosid-2-ulose 2-reductase
MRKILVIGATSAIAEATVRIWAQQGDYLFLVARNLSKLQSIAEDLRVRGCPKVDIYAMDATDFDAHEPMLNAAEQAMNGLDTVLIAHGTLSDQVACQESVELTLQEINTNALSVIALLTNIANRFERQKMGTIAVISSVAGDRGRQSNYVYGSAKAMVTVFTSGLRQRLYKSGVSVVTIKPGFVDTPMTKNIQKNFLWASPQKVGEKISRYVSKKNGNEIYCPGFWLVIMMVIKLIPTRLFQRVNL